MLFLWKCVIFLSLGLSSTTLTGNCQVDLILLWDRKEVHRVPGMSIFSGSVITGFIASGGLVVI